MTDVRSLGKEKGSRNNRRRRSLLARLDEFVVFHGHLAGQSLAAVSGGAVGVDRSTPCGHNKRNRWIFSSWPRHQWRLCEALTEAKGLPAQFCFFPVFPDCQPVSMLVIKQRPSLFPPETPPVKLTDFLLQFFVLSISEDVCLKRKRRRSRSFRSFSGCRATA